MRYIVQMTYLYWRFFLSFILINERVKFYDIYPPLVYIWFEPYYQHMMKKIYGNRICLQCAPYYWYVRELIMMMVLIFMICIILKESKFWMMKFEFVIPSIPIILWRQLLLSIIFDAPQVTIIYITHLNARRCPRLLI